MSEVPMGGTLQAAMRRCLRDGGAAGAGMFGLLGKAGRVVAGDFNARALGACDLPEDTNRSDDKISRKVGTMNGGRAPGHDGVTVLIGIPV